MCNGMDGRMHCRRFCDLRMRRCRCAHDPTTRRRAAASACWEPHGGFDWLTGQVSASKVGHQPGAYGLSARRLQSRSISQSESFTRLRLKADLGTRSGEVEVFVAKVGNARHHSAPVCLWQTLRYTFC